MYLQYDACEGVEPIVDPSVTSSLSFAYVLITEQAQDHGDSWESFVIAKHCNCSYILSKLVKESP